MGARWSYEYVVVTVSCDDHFFSIIDGDGEQCEFLFEECDFYARLT